VREDRRRGDESRCPARNYVVLVKDISVSSNYVGDGQEKRRKKRKEKKRKENVGITSKNPI